MAIVSLPEAKNDYLQNQDQQRGSAPCHITKLSVSIEVAELVKVYCVLHNKKMIDYVNEILSRELSEFKHDLENLKKLKEAI